MFKEKLSLKTMAYNILGLRIIKMPDYFNIKNWLGVWYGKRGFQLVLCYKGNEFFRFKFNNH